MKNRLLITMFITFFTITIYAQKETVIVGEMINNTIYSEFYFEELLTGTMVDTIKIGRKGKFKIEIELEKQDYYKLRFDENNYIVYIPEPGENAVFKIDVNDFRKPVIDGSKHTELVYSILNETDELDKEIIEFQEKIRTSKKKIIRNMVTNNAGSLSCLFFIEELNINEDLEIYKLLNDGLKKYSDNSLVFEFNQKVEAASVLAIGSEAPEIVIPGINGDEIKLSSLRGNYVLIDFWASWCAPCRSESANLLRIYNKYNPLGFNIFSISLDETADVWIEAVEKDGIEAWFHGIDNNENENSASSKYNVTSIPFTILIDKSGKIIAKNINSNELEEKLKDIYGR